MGNIPHWPVNLGVLPEVRLAIAVSIPFSGVQRFLLPLDWAVHFYDYRATLVMGGHPLTIDPGTVSVTPANIAVEYRWPSPSSHAAAHVRLAPLDGGPAQAAANVPAIQQLGRDFARLRADFIEAVRFVPTRPRRAQVRIWDILWELATRGADERDDASRLHPALQRAADLIEMRLTQPLRVAELASKVELSHNQLTRLFREAFGTTVVGYIRRRRVERAAHLLADSTLPIKAIAVEVGLPDLQRFNKVIRGELGRSPRDFRRRGRA